MHVMSNKTLARTAFILAFLFPIAGLILGIVTLVKIKNSADKAWKGLSIAAIAIGAILTLLSIIIIPMFWAAYFGVINPSELKTPNLGCSFAQMLPCTDYSINQNSISLSLQNNAGYDITIHSIKVSSNALEGGACSEVAGTEIKYGQSHNFLLKDCNFVDAGHREDLPNLYGFMVWYSQPDSTEQYWLGGKIWALNPKP